MSLREKNKGSLVVVPGAPLRGTYSGVARPSGTAVDALKRVATRDPSFAKMGSIGFVIDATASRSRSWEEAQEIQARMFDSVSRLGKMCLRLVHYGGNELTANDWQADPKKVAEHMANVGCEGGNTQILESLSVFLNDAQGLYPRSVILVGDCFEEDMDDLPPLAAELNGRNIKVFSFLDGNDETAEGAFKFLAEKTGGAFAKFGSNMPLQDLCEGVALMSVGGVSALDRLKNTAAKTLLLSAKP